MKVDFTHTNFINKNTTVKKYCKMPKMTQSADTLNLSSKAGKNTDKLKLSEILCAAGFLLKLGVQVLGVVLLFKFASKFGKKFN